MARVIDAGVREQIVRRVREGERVAVLADEFGVSNKTIYSWISSSDSSGVRDKRDLEISRLKRELENAYALLGRAAAQMSNPKKQS